MTSPFDGVMVFIWNFQQCDGGDYDAIAARIKQSGARGVIVKSADGGRWFNQGVAVSTIVSELQARGLVVGTWDYLYGADAGTVFGGPQAAPTLPGSLARGSAATVGSYRVAGIDEEIKRAVECITEAKPDFHVFDVEAEYEQQVGADARASRFLQGVLAGIPAGFPLAYSPLPVIRFHLALPYRQFSDAGCAMLPQLYWTGLGMSEAQTVGWFYADASQYQLESQPIVPAYEDAPGVRPDAASHASFLRDCATQGAGGVSVWSYEHLDASGWARVAQAAKRFPVPPVTPPDPDTSLRKQVADLTATNQSLVAANTVLSSNVTVLTQIIASAKSALRAVLAALEG